MHSKHNLPWPTSTCMYWHCGYVKCGRLFATLHQSMPKDVKIWGYVALLRAQLYHIMIRDWIAGLIRIMVKVGTWLYKPPVAWCFCGLVLKIGTGLLYTWFMQRASGWGFGEHCCSKRWEILRSLVKNFIHLSHLTNLCFVSHAGLCKRGPSRGC